MVRQDRFLTGILVAIGLLVVLALVLFFLRRGQASYLPGDTPEEVVHNYTLALQRGDFEQAYSYLADSETRPTPDQFRQSLLVQRTDLSSNAVEIGDALIDGDEAEVNITILRTGGGLFSDFYRDPQIAMLRREADSWKIVNLPYPYWVWEWSPQSVPAKPVPAPIGF
jgi:hypothetical protein